MDLGVDLLTFMLTAEGKGGALVTTCYVTDQLKLGNGKH